MVKWQGRQLLGEDLLEPRHQDAPARRVGLAHPGVVPEALRGYDAGAADNDVAVDDALADLLAIERSGECPAEFHPIERRALDVED